VFFAAVDLRVGNALACPLLEVVVLDFELRKIVTPRWRAPSLFLGLWLGYSNYIFVRRRTPICSSSL
jgi:hypothetical protein